MANNWYSPQYPGGSSAPDVTPINPGAPTPWYRDPLDAARSAFHARTPDAQYPDGYLGATESRRERLGDAPQDRKPSERGVHKGEKLNGQDYFWPTEFGPMTAIRQQGYKDPKRFVPYGIKREAKTAQPERAPDEMVAELKRLAPTWSTGPGMSVVGYG